jgi:hypothetical protein
MVKKYIALMLAGSFIIISPTYAAEKPKTFASISIALKTLKIAPEDRTGYVRTKFTHWVNSDGNKLGCDARKEAIIRDAITKPKVDKGCVLTGGTWVSAYDNLPIDKASSLDVDHMVPLAEAWDSGASAWTPEKRKQYANDLSDNRHLLSVSANSNRSKSDQDPTDWVPTYKPYICTYLANWVSIKIRWSLSIDAKEFDSINKASASCPKKSISIVPIG